MKKSRVNTFELIINFLIVILAIITLLSKYPLILNEPIGELDKAHHLHAYELTYDKSGNPVPEDFYLARLYDFILERPFGVTGVPVGWLIIFENNYGFYKPNTIIVLFFIIAALIAYLIQRQDDTNFKTPLIFVLFLLSPRGFFSLVWGQFNFLTVTPFIMISIYFFNKYWVKGDRSNLIFTGLALFISLQIHMIVSMIALFYILSVLMNEVIKSINGKKINCKIRSKKFKGLILMLVLVLVSQLISFRAITNMLLSGEFVKEGTFNFFEAFIMSETGGYPSWFFNNLWLIYGLMLVLGPLGVIYAFLKKDFKYLIWFLLTFIYSRPSLLPLSHLQYRVNIFLPFIAAFISKDGLKLINAFFRNNKIKKLLPIIFSFVVIIIAFFSLPVNSFEWPSSFDEVINWVDDNLTNEVITTNFPISQKYCWWLTLLTDNNFFEPITIDDKLKLTGYEDIYNNYSITYLIMSKDGFEKNVSFDQIVFQNQEFMVISV